MKISINALNRNVQVEMYNILTRPCENLKCFAQELSDIKDTHSKYEHIEIIDRLICVFNKIDFESDHTSNINNYIKYIMYGIPFKEDERRPYLNRHSAIYHILIESDFHKLKSYPILYKIKNYLDHIKPIELDIDDDVEEDDSDEEE